MRHCIEILLILLAATMPGIPHAEGAPDENAAREKEKTWWELREEKRPDLYYPHRAHREVMRRGGDACMLCHPFMKNEIRDPEALNAVTRIANEPLKAICHECHVRNISAPSRCDTCHKDIGAIRPPDHGQDYRRTHGEDSRRDAQACSECHIGLSFCTDCHFRRDSSRRQVHALGYRAAHGIESRADPAACGKCHNPDYCRNCHQSLP